MISTHPDIMRFVFNEHLFEKPFNRHLFKLLAAAAVAFIEGTRSKRMKRPCDARRSNQAENEQK